ncbi:MAG: secretin N-terminal domain-containing protein [Armatimonadota bacterium]
MYRYLLTLLFIGLLAGSIAFVAFGQVAPPTQPAAPAAEAPAAPAPAPAPETPQPIRGPFEGNGGGAPTVMIPDRPIDLEKDTVSIAFSKADLLNVLNFLSMATGIPIVVDADVKGTVTINSMRKVQLPLAYDVINSALRARGYTMVGTLKDRMIRVSTLEKAVADRAVVQEGKDYTKLGTSDTFVTQVIPLENISAARLKEELKPLVADKQANLLAVGSSNTLIVTDTEGNVKRLLQVIELLDKDTSDVLDVDVYSCKYASAAALVLSLEKVFGITSTPPGGQQPGRGQPQGGGQPGQPGGQPTFATTDGPLSLKGEVHIASDDRTNSIVISATKEKIKLIRSLIEKLDVDTTSEVKARVFPLKNADATSAASQLNSLFEQPQGGGSNNRSPFFFYGGQPQSSSAADNYASLKRNLVVADVRTNSLVVTATEQNMKQFEELIAQLDTPNALSEVARTFQLKYASAGTVATTLNNLFRGQRGGFSFFDVIMGNSRNQDDPISRLRNITVVAESKTNTLLITGPPQAFAMIETIIAQLDRRTPQVFIQVAIVDVTLDDTNKFGIEWQWSNDPHGTEGAKTLHDVGPGFGLADEKYGLKYSVLSDNLKVLLHALTTRSNVKVYSTPSITTADNVPATISIGQDIPFVSTSEETDNGNLRQTVDFKNVSITLNVTPHVTAMTADVPLITMDVQQTINELIGREIELNAPIIANRQAKTTVMVKDGQTIVIGGIIKENSERQTKAVPVLSKIPLLGELFKSRTNIKSKSELMVFITPRILKDDDSVDERTAAERNKLSEPLPASIDIEKK